MIDNLRERDYNILVINALNGAFALKLRQRYPRSRIICVEIFSYYREHLTKLGFEVIKYEDIHKVNMKKKFNVIAQNPPYLNGQWKTFIKNAWDKYLTDDGVMVTVNPDPIESIGAQSKKWQVECRRMNLQYRKSATEYFPGVNSGPIGMFYHDKQMPFNESAFETNDIKHIIKNKMIENGKKNTVERYSNLGKYDHLRKIEEKRKRKQATDMKDNSLTPTKEHSVPVVVGMVESGIDIRYFSPDGKRTHDHSGSTFIMNRFFGQNTVASLVDNIENCEISGKILYLEALANETLESFKSVFCSRLYRFTLKAMRNGYMDTRPMHLTKLLCPPLIKVYTEEELYQLNGITDPEHISYIEKNYLGKQWTE